MAAIHHTAPATRHESVVTSIAARPQSAPPAPTLFLPNRNLRPMDRPREFPNIISTPSAPYTKTSGSVIRHETVVAPVASTTSSTLLAPTPIRHHGNLRRLDGLSQFPRPVPKPSAPSKRTIGSVIGHDPVVSPIAPTPPPTVHEYNRKKRSLDATKKPARVVATRRPPPSPYNRNLRPTPETSSHDYSYKAPKYDDTQPEPPECIHELVLAISCGDKKEATYLLSDKELLVELEHGRYPEPAAACDAPSPVSTPLAVWVLKLALKSNPAASAKTDILVTLLGRPYYPVRRNKHWSSIFRWALCTPGGKRAVVEAISRQPWNILRERAYTLIRYGANGAHRLEDNIPELNKTTLHGLLLFNSNWPWNSLDTAGFKSDVAAWWDIDQKVSDPRTIYSRWWGELNNALQVHLDWFLRDDGCKEGPYQDLDHRLIIVTEFLMSQQMKRPMSLQHDSAADLLQRVLSPQSLELLDNAYFGNIEYDTRPNREKHQSARSKLLNVWRNGKPNGLVRSRYGRY